MQLAQLGFWTTQGERCPFCPKRHQYSAHPSALRRLLADTGLDAGLGMVKHLCTHVQPGTHQAYPRLGSVKLPGSPGPMHNHARALKISVTNHPVTEGGFQEACRDVQNPATRVGGQHPLISSDQSLIPPTTPQRGQKPLARWSNPYVHPLCQPLTTSSTVQHTRTAET